MMIDDYSVIELTGMFFATIMVITILPGVVLSHFIIKPADRLFTGKTHKNRVWYPLCFWGMGEYALALMTYKSQTTREKYPLYFEEWASGSRRSRWITGILVSIYIPAMVSGALMVVFYMLHKLIG